MSNKDSQALVDHFFRSEYGKMVAVISRYLGPEQIETAEDIVQDTLLSAVENWKHHGIPPSPEAWLYKAAKNKVLNHLRHKNYVKELGSSPSGLAFTELSFNDDAIFDDMLRVMTSCCQPGISEEIQITLILKTLCGFSISEIAASYGTSNEAINKRLVRGRKKLKESDTFNQQWVDLNANVEVLLKTIYLLFNEGYSPARKSQVIRMDLCLEAIRLAELIVSNVKVNDKQSSHSLLALMYLNTSRFEARMEVNEGTVDMEGQNRNLWNQDLINKGLDHLSKAQSSHTLSYYLVLASISANHCVAPSFEETNWQEIVKLYDALLAMENAPHIKLNRIVALSKSEGVVVALEAMQKEKSILKDHLYFSVLANFSKENGDIKTAVEYYSKAISCCPNDRDKRFFRKKMEELVPIIDAHV